MAVYTIPERVQLVKWVYGGSSHRSARDLFSVQFPERPIPDVRTVGRLIARFEETGSVLDRPHTGRPCSVTTEDNAIAVGAAIAAEPRTSIRQLAGGSGLSYSSVHKLLHRGKFHPYKIQLHQELNEDDYDRRLEFCEWCMDKLAADPEFSEAIVFSDEATFQLNGEVNRHNSRYWANDNPRWMRALSTQYPEKVNVWAGILGSHIIGPFFIRGNLTGDNYLDLLMNDVGPTIAEVSNNEHIWFQQDGASPHYARNVREYLDLSFPNSWIGRRGAQEWPPRSPDLAPNDFFLWGHIKSIVYRNQPDDLNVLKERIVEACRAITPEQLGNVRQEFEDRLGFCRFENGGHFENLL